MKKRIIAIVLVALLVGGGLGSFAYAQSGSIDTRFTTYWIYDSTEDTFTNIDVIGRKEWHADVGSRDLITGLTLRLDTALAFDHYRKENLTTMGPPSYVWSFGDFPDGGGGEAYVGSLKSLNPFWVPFKPGFDCSRSANTVFTEVDDTQTLTITLTPIGELKPFVVFIHADENELVDPVITPPISGGDIELSHEGHWLHITPTGLAVDTTWSIEVTIEVRPKVSKVEFMPFVSIGWHEDGESDTTTGTSLTYEVYEEVPDEMKMGTWTCSAKEEHTWNWKEEVRRHVSWHPYSKDMSNYVNAEFQTAWYYFPPGDTLTNHKVTGRREWNNRLTNTPDETGSPITGVGLKLDSALTFDYVEPREPQLVTMGPPTYKWSFGNIAQGADAFAWVGFASPDPCPVKFTPGFDASRSANRTKFLLADGMQTQTLTITVTPQVEMTGFGIKVWAPKDDKVDPVIKSAVGDSADILYLDDHFLVIAYKGETAPQVGTEYSYTVTIEVTPKVPEVAFMPGVAIFWDEPPTSGTASGSSLPYTVPMIDTASEMGTWTWSATGEGDLAWHWTHALWRVVWFNGYSNFPPVTMQGSGTWFGLEVDEGEYVDAKVALYVDTETGIFQGRVSIPGGFTRDDQFITGAYWEADVTGWAIYDNIVIVHVAGKAYYLPSGAPALGPDEMWLVGELTGPGNRGEISVYGVQPDPNDPDENRLFKIPGTIIIR